MIGTLVLLLPACGPGQLTAAVESPSGWVLTVGWKGETKTPDEVATEPVITLEVVRKWLAPMVVD